MGEGYSRNAPNSHTVHSYSPQTLIPPATAQPPSSPARAAYIMHGLNSAVRLIMEAEQLNIIANRLVDIAQRATELRRYL